MVPAIRESLPVANNISKCDSKVFYIDTTFTSGRNNLQLLRMKTHNSGHKIYFIPCGDISSNFTLTITPSKWKKMQENVKKIILSQKKKKKNNNTEMALLENDLMDMCIS